MTGARSSSPIDPASRSVEPPLSRFARRVLQHLARRGAAPLGPGGECRLGVDTAPASLVKDLARRDFVAIEEGRLRLNSRGDAYLRRQAARAKRGTATAPADFAAQHQVMRRRRLAGARGVVMANVNLAESPLWWLKSRRDKKGRPLISEAQYEAGERLRADWELAHRGPRLTMNWDAPPLGRAPRGAPEQHDPTPGELRARLRLERALAALGPGLEAVVVRICCQHEGLEVAERGLGWPQRSAKVVLGIALERLACHYGLTPRRP
ncbi:MAG: DUF6456 domain-containing protein [Pseudomonadota bacterium]